MGQVAYHFDRPPVDDKIRVDYIWEKDGEEYYIQNIPCTDFFFSSSLNDKEYWTKEVSKAVGMLIYLQENDETVPKVIDFMKIEDMIDDFK